MSADAALGFRTLAFGDLNTGLWGAAFTPLDASAGDIDTANGGAAFAGIAGEPANAPVALDPPGSLSFAGTSADQPWHLRANGIELTLSPTGDAAGLSAVEQGIGGFSQLCRVEGRVHAAGAERALECFGQRGTRTIATRAGQLESLRDVTAWFGPADGLALVSVRPRRVSGHDRDGVASVLFEDGHPLALEDPRLSTTYTGAGLPSRASLELWLETSADEAQLPSGDEQADESPAHHFPRRAAGERVGACAQLSTAALELHAELFHWHMRGLDGAGVYVLARPR